MQQLPAVNLYFKDFPVIYAQHNNEEHNMNYNT